MPNHSPAPGTRWSRGGTTWTVLANSRDRVLLASDADGRPLEVPPRDWPAGFVHVPGDDATPTTEYPVPAVLVGGDTGAWFEKFREDARSVGVDLVAHVSGRVRQRIATLPTEVDLVVLLAGHIGHPARDIVVDLSSRLGIPVVSVRASGFRTSLAAGIQRIRDLLPAHRAAPTEGDVDALELLDALGIPGWVDDAVTLRREAERLRRALRRFREILRLPTEEALLLLEELAARARHVLDNEGAIEPLASATILREIFDLVEQIRGEAPVHIHGAAQEERPRDLSWARDAEALRNRLEDLVLGRTVFAGNPAREGWWEEEGGGWVWRDSRPQVQIQAETRGTDPPPREAVLGIDRSVAIGLGVLAVLGAASGALAPK